MTSIGETLRRERLRRGLSVAQVHDRTKISAHLLEAIEADQFDRIPSGVFARSFIRQYAQVLELDEEDLLAQFKQQFEESPESAAAPLAPRPEVSSLARVRPLADFLDRFRTNSSMSALVWSIAVMLACAGAYSLWQRPRNSAPKVETAVAAPQPRPPLEQPASLRPGTPAPAAEPSRSDFRPAELSDSGSIKIPSHQPPVTPVVNAAGEASRPASAAMRVAFAASEPVWISIKSDGTRVYSGTLQPHQSLEMGASQKMTVLIGNAGGLEISLNGKPVGPLGPRGEICTILLTPNGAHILPRTPPAPPTSDDSTAPAEAGARP